MKKFVAIIMSALLLFGGLCVSADGADMENIPYDTYTYWSDNGARFLAGSRAMYETAGTYSGSDIGVSPFTEPTDIVSDNKGMLYILDGNNSRIVITDENFALKGEIKSFGGKTFKGAKGITVSDSGDIYVADTENSRVLAGGADGSLKAELSCPDNEIIPDDYTFNPIQLTVDKNGYLYVMSDGSFYGALVFAPDGSTEGFFGANKVNASVGDLIDTLWNRWFMTDDQRASQIQKIPYQFSDLVADDSGLMYTTTGSLSSWGTQSGQIRCLGPGGTNVMKNRIGRDVVDSDSFNFADEGVASLAVGKRVQNFVSLDIENGYIYALDQTYGRVFVYSQNCELLTVMGGGVKLGVQKGTFENAAAVAVYNDTVYVLDNVKGNVTVFKMNEYGRLVKEAARLTSTGKYSEAAPLWSEAIALDRNNQLAYRGLARDALARGEYKAAMDYAKTGLDRGIYDQAFEYVRNSFLEKYLSLIIVGVTVIIAAAVIFAVYKKKRGIKLPAAPRLSLALGATFHPFENFRAVKYKGQGSVLIAAVLLALFYVSGVLEDFYSGFAHSTFNAENYNSLLTLVGTVGVAVLWVICNWAVSVLAEGKGRIKEVFIVTCYSLVPQIVSNVICLILSNVLLIKESTAITVISTVAIILTGLLLCIGTMIVHEFDFFRFLLTTVITLVAMAIVIFLVFMIIILLQQFFAFIRTVFIEVTYR